MHQDSTPARWLRAASARLRSEHFKAAAPFHASSLALLIALSAGCGDSADSPAEQAVASQMPSAPAMTAPAMPAAQTPAPAPAAPANPAPSPAMSETPMPMLQTPPPAAPGSSGGSQPGDGEGGGDEPAGGEDTPPGEDPMTPPDPPGAFNPCPAQGACAILPLGDSITFGLGAQTPTANQGGYRVELFRLALADDHAISFVGRQANGPNTVDNQPFPRGHEGYSGATINDGGNQLSNRLDAALAAVDPNIVLLMIGTNDVFGNQTNPPSDLGNLLDQITNGEPDALVVVAQIVPTRQDATNQRVQAYNATIPGLVQERVAAGKHIALVDMFTPFTQNQNFANALLSDVVHPNDAGYVIMANTWYAAIEGFLR